MHAGKDLGEDGLDPLLVVRKQLGVQIIGLRVGLADEHLTTHADVVGRAVAAGVCASISICVERDLRGGRRLVARAHLVAASGSTGGRLGAVDRHPVTSPRLGSRPGHRGDVLEVVEVAVERDVLVLGREPEEVEDLAIPWPDLLRGHPDEEELGRDAAGGADLEPAV